MLRLNTQKAIEAIAVLMREEDTSRMNYMRLLKLLYMADRESLEKRGTTITGDRVVAMDQGTVLSGVYDLIKGVHPDTVQAHRFFKRVHFDLQMIEDPGVSTLSPYEIEVLQDVARRFIDMDEWHMVAITHELPEFKKNQPPPRGMRPIPLSDVLEAVGRSADAAAIIHDAEQDAAVERFFARHPREAR